MTNSSKETVDMTDPPSQSRGISKSRFLTCLTLLLTLFVPMLIIPASVCRLLQETYAFISGTFGSLYLLSGLTTFGILIWLTFSAYGKVRLGSINEQTEFSTISWISMLFCAGIGAGLMRWAALEWAYYYLDPPHGLAPRSAAATDWATSYPLFHWGPIAWSYYCLPTLAIAYPYYVKKIPVFSYGISLYGLLGKRCLDGSLARVFDILFVISLLGGAGYSLGISVPLISGAFCELTGFRDGFATRAVFALVCVLIFSCSVFVGLSKGIRLLSEINAYLALLLLLFVFAVGPTFFILESSFGSFAFMCKNFLRMSTGIGSSTDSSFIENWTVFYWAWWLAYAPFIGLFVARISRGRTLREVILAMLVFGSGGCMLFFQVLGNYALHLETVQEADVLSMLTSEDGGHVTATLAILKTLPLPSIVIAIFCFICILFCSTTYDSASYTIASAVTLKHKETDEPSKWNCAFWAFALAALPISLMWIDERQGTAAAELGMKSILLLTSLPILFLTAFSAWSLIRQLRIDKKSSSPSRSPLIRRGEHE